MTEKKGPHTKEFLSVTALKLISNINNMFYNSSFICCGER